MAEEDVKSEFWKSILKAAEVETRSASSIRGASGFSHPIVAVGVDERRRRVVIISGESDARSAQGRSIRAQIRFKPREGLLARLGNIFSIKIDLNLKDLFK